MVHNPAKGKSQYPIMDLQDQLTMAVCQLKKDDEFQSCRNEVAMAFVDWRDAQIEGEDKTAKSKEATADLARFITEKLKLVKPI